MKYSFKWSVFGRCLIRFVFPIKSLKETPNPMMYLLTTPAPHDVLTWVGVRWIRLARCSLSGADRYFCCLNLRSNS